MPNIANTLVFYLHVFSNGKIVTIFEMLKSKVDQISKLNFMIGILKIS